jgi:2-polyprenyl-3-methyl-5-hydroxy-6-metoxy-1,4-benzoquinol methylase
MTSFDPKWEQIHRDRAWGDVADNHLVRFVRRNFPKPISAHNRALDIGCGIGAQAWFLAMEGFDVTGIDASESAISRAEKHPSDNETSGHISFIVEDVCDMPDFAPFDLIVDVCCLQHIPKPDIATALNKIHGLLEPQGVFFSITARWDHSDIGGPPIRFMRHDEVTALYRGAGFVIKSVERAFHSDNGKQISHWIIVAKHG